MTQMNWTFRGKVAWKFGDHFTPDLITEYPKYKSILDPKGLAKICMIGIDPEFPKRVKKGDFIIAGRNFGFGHPHSQAHMALMATGISAVLAESFARGWFRAAVSLGLPVVICKDISKSVDVGDELQLDLKTGEVRNLANGIFLKSEPLPQFILDILESGGLVPHLKRMNRDTNNGLGN